jgi:hypothetical protein
MARCVLQTNFTFTVSAEEFQAAAEPLADAFAAVPGLAWKVWLLNPQTRQAGGIYLFESEEALDAFLDGPLVEGMRNHPAIVDVTIDATPVWERVSAVTRAPIPVGAAGD